MDLLFALLCSQNDRFLRVVAFYLPLFDRAMRRFSSSHAMRRSVFRLSSLMKLGLPYDIGYFVLGKQYLSIIRKLFQYKSRPCKFLLSMGYKGHIKKRSIEPSANSTYNM